MGCIQKYSCSDINAGFRGTTIRGLNENVHDHNDKKNFAVVETQN